MLFLGIDIGGTKRVITVADQRGEPLGHIRHSMENTADWRADLGYLIRDARVLLDEWQTRTGESLAGVGVSVPGPVDAKQGILLNPPNLPGWHGASIAVALAEALGVEAWVDNDANAAALAEFQFGAGRDVDNMIYLTMSTGVGAGVIAQGQILNGAFGGAGEAGHLPIEFPGRVCRCGLHGCLEAYVGGNAWRAHLQKAVPDGSKILVTLDGNRAAITPEVIVAAALAGDAFALKEFDRWLDYLAHGIVPLVMLFDPEKIVLGTIATAAGEALCFEPLRKRVAARLWPHQAERLSIVSASLGDELPQRAGLAVVLSAMSAAAVSSSTKRNADSAA